QRGVGRRDPRSGRVVHTSRRTSSAARCPCGPPRGLGGAHRDHACGRSCPPRGRRTAGLGGAPRGPAGLAELPYRAGRHTRLTPWMDHPRTIEQVVCYDRAAARECFLSPRSVAMATMIDGESYVGRVLMRPLSQAGDLRLYLWPLRCLKSRMGGPAFGIEVNGEEILRFDAHGPRGHWHQGGYDKLGVGRVPGKIV